LSEFWFFDSAALRIGSDRDGDCFQHPAGELHASGALFPNAGRDDG
jgi:hypothetical protein